MAALEENLGLASVTNAIPPSQGNLDTDSTSSRNPHDNTQDAQYGFGDASADRD